LLVFLAMTALVGLYVYCNNTASFANRSMQLVMKNMGHNLLLLPHSADLQSVCLCTEDQVTFPEQTTLQLAEQRRLASKYYVSVLQGWVTVEGRRLLLTGIEPVARADESREKGNMVLPLATGQARLGAEAAGQLGKQRGDVIEIGGHRFDVTEVLPPKATVDDCRVYVPLDQGQALLGKEGHIHFILAFLCLHAGSLDQTLQKQQQMLADVCPDLRQISRMDIAQGRYLARLTTQKMLYYLLAIVAVTTVVVVAVTGLQEVHERRHETGIMIAMGVSQAYVVSLYLAKTLLLALAASVVGFLLGSWLAVRLTEPFLVVHTAQVAVLWEHLPTAMGLTGAVALLAESLPMVKLLSLDPNNILSEQ
jgi:predicted lysophospholipase L1 biosynthesis ABC-type transport system permease subunit